MERLRSRGPTTGGALPAQAYCRRRPTAGADLLPARDTAGAGFVFGQYSHADLSDRLDLLAVLYHDSGNLDKAISTLKESKQVCEKHGLKFDGVDLLQDYLQKEILSRTLSGRLRGRKTVHGSSTQTA